MNGNFLLGLGALLLGLVSAYKLQRGEFDGVLGVSVALFFTFLAFWLELV